MRGLGLPLDPWVGNEARGAATAEIDVNIDVALQDVRGNVEGPERYPEAAADVLRAGVETVGDYSIPHTEPAHRAAPLRQAGRLYNLATEGSTDTGRSKRPPGRQP